MNVVFRTPRAPPAIAGTREQILDRIFVLLGSISGVRDCSRNRSEYTQDNLPAIILLDGSEQNVSNIPPLKIVKMPPAIICLKPEIFVILPQRDDATNQTLGGNYQPIGPDLTFWRDAVLAAVINDPVLVGVGREGSGLLTTTGQIVYRGCSTDMATGRTMWGQLQLFLEFYYVWSPPTA